MYVGREKRQAVYYSIGQCSIPSVGRQAVYYYWAMLDTLSRQAGSVL